MVVAHQSAAEPATATQVARPERSPTPARRARAPVPHPRAPTRSRHHPRGPVATARDVDQFTAEQSAATNVLTDHEAATWAA